MLTIVCSFPWHDDRKFICIKLKSFLKTVFVVISDILGSNSYPRAFWIHQCLRAVVINSNNGKQIRGYYICCCISVLFSRLHLPPLNIHVLKQTPLHIQMSNSEILSNILPFEHCCFWPHNQRYMWFSIYIKIYSFDRNVDKSLPDFTR